MADGEKRYDSSRICGQDRAQLRDGDSLAQPRHGSGRLQGRDNGDPEHMAHTGIRATNADAEVGAEAGSGEESREEAGQVVVVPLTQSQAAIIDAEDAERVLAYKWHALLVFGRYRAVRNFMREDGGWGHMYMHRFVVDAPPGRQVDHINGD